MAADRASAARAQQQAAAQQRAAQQRVQQLQHARQVQQRQAQQRLQQQRVQQRALQRQAQRQRVWQRTAGKRAARQVETELAIEEREQRQRAYASWADRQYDEAVAATEEAADLTAELDSLLADGLATPLRFGRAQLRGLYMMEPLEVDGLDVPLEPPRREDYRPAGYRAALAGYEAAEFERVRRLSTAKRDHQRRQAAAADRVWADYQAGDRDAIEELAGAVLASRPWPLGFDPSWRLRYWPQSRRLDVVYALPGTDVVPHARQYRYVADRDEIVGEPIPGPEIARRYTNVVAQTALLVLFDLFDALDVDAVSLKGRPPLVDVAVTRRRWASVRLDRDDPEAVLRSVAAPATP